MSHMANNNGSSDGGLENRRSRLRRRRRHSRETTDSGGCTPQPVLAAADIAEEPPSAEANSNLGRASVTGDIAELPMVSGEGQKLTARRKWSKANYEVLIECHEKALLEGGRGVGRRTLVAWEERGLFTMRENALMNQLRMIRKKGWLTEVEIGAIRRRVKDMERVGIPMDGGAENHVEGVAVVAEGVLEEGGVAEALEEMEVVGEVNLSADQLGDGRVGIPMDGGATGNAENHAEVGAVDAVGVARGHNLDAEHNDLLQRLRELLLEEGDVMPKNLRRVDRGKIRIATQKVNRILPFVQTNNISGDKDLVRCAALLVQEMVGVNRKTSNKQRKEPMWKRRIETDIVVLRKHLSKIERWYKGKWVNGKQPERDYLDRKYHIRANGFRTVIEQLKQRVMSKAQKVKRYTERCEQFQQNRLFENNPKQFFSSLNGNSGENVVPNAEEAREFWSEIWSQDVEHNKNAEWIQDIKSDLQNKPKQEDIVVTRDDVKMQVRKLPNWKSPGPDGIQGFWLKKFVAMHEAFAVHLNDCVASGVVPSWMTVGKTTLAQKDKSKGAEVGNYRPIACLNLLWKVLTGIFSEKTYQFLSDNDLLPAEQKGGRKRSQGTKDQLVIDKVILRHCKRRHTNLCTAWIDFKKAYDLVPHSWIVETLKMFGIAENVIQLLQGSMKDWKTKLYSNSEYLADVDIRRGIFQGDSFSPLLFVIALIPISLVLRKVDMGYKIGKDGPSINHLLFMDDIKLFAKSENQIDSLVKTVHECSQDMGMKFGISKCAVLTMKRGKRAHCRGIKLPTEEVIAEPDDSGYKYLGVLEVDDILHREMKEITQKAYKNRLKLILKSKLNSKNLVHAINIWAVAVIRYGAAIVKWTVEEIDVLDRQTRKLMTMHGAFHPKSDVKRLYLKRALGGRGLVSVRDCVDGERRNLAYYISRSEEELLKCVAVEMGIDRDQVEDKKEFTKRKVQEKQEALLNMKLHGQFERETQEVKDKEASWMWLRQGDLKRGTEALLMAAQEQSLNTNSIAHSIYKTTNDPKCRLCGERIENVTHIVSGCKMLAQKNYKRRHDKVCQHLHWLLCQKHGYEVAGKWYEHVPAKVMEEEGKPKLYWDHDFQTDRIIEHRRPDIVVLYPGQKECQIIDVAIPADQNIARKEFEKIDKYTELKVELSRLWGLPENNVKVIPVVIGALGSIPFKLKKFLDQLQIKYDLRALQKSALLGTANILRKVLSV